MSPFTPLKTFQGLSMHELKTLVNGRDIYIWGCGHLGRIIKRNLEKNGISVKSFCDSNSQLNMTFVDNVQVINPNDVLNIVKLGQAFIIIASAQYKDEIEKHCFKAGLVKKEDYLSYIHISRPEAAVDVSGKCNLKCPSCPRGNMDVLRPEGYMTLSIYKQTLNKLLLEIPQLTNIELSTWGEPFMNPELAEIIRITEMKVPCSVHTNLQSSDILENVIKAQPSQMIISTSGYGKSYEINHAGGSWQTFLDNIHFLKELINKHNPKTQFTVLYHLYRNNQQQDLDNLCNLCLKLGLRLHTTWAYLNPYDKILDYCEGRDIGIKAKKVLDILPWDLNRSLELSKAEAHKQCLCQRIFPAINWDLSVSTCHIYYNPLIVNNFLNISLDELLKLRSEQLQCRECQKHGLHRLDIDMFLKKYSAKDILVGSKN